MPQKVITWKIFHPIHIVEGKQWLDWTANKMNWGFFSFQVLIIIFILLKSALECSMLNNCCLVRLINAIFSVNAIEQQWLEQIKKIIIHYWNLTNAQNEKLQDGLSLVSYSLNTVLQGWLYERFQRILNQNQIKICLTRIK